MIILGLILVIVGYLASISILITLGVILVVIGAVLWILGSVGRRSGVARTTGDASRGTRCGPSPNLGEGPQRHPGPECRGSADDTRADL